MPVGSQSSALANAACTARTAGWPGPSRRSRPPGHWCPPGACRTRLTRWRHSARAGRTALATRSSGPPVAAVATRPAVSQSAEAGIAVAAATTAAALNAVARERSSADRRGAAREYRSPGSQTARGAGAGRFARATRTAMPGRTTVGAHAAAFAVTARICGRGSGGSLTSRAPLPSAASLAAFAAGGAVTPCPRRGTRSRESAGRDRQSARGVDGPAFGGTSRTGFSTGRSGRCGTGIASRTSGLLCCSASASTAWAAESALARSTPRSPSTAVSCVALERALGDNEGSGVVDGSAETGSARRSRTSGTGFGTVATRPALGTRPSGSPGPAHSPCAALTPAATGPASRDVVNE